MYLNSKAFESFAKLMCIIKAYKHADKSGKITCLNCLNPPVIFIESAAMVAKSSAVPQTLNTLLGLNCDRLRPEQGEHP